MARHKVQSFGCLEDNGLGELGDLFLESVTQSQFADLLAQFVRWMSKRAVRG